MINLKIFNRNKMNKKIINKSNKKNKYKKINKKNNQKKINLKIILNNHNKNNK